MARKEPKPPERWRDVPGFGGTFQVSTLGHVRRRLGTGRWRTVKVVTGRGYSGKCDVVNLHKGNHNTQISVLRLVALTFYPDMVKDGDVVVHRNGLHSDNSVWNVQILTRSEAMSRVAGWRRMSVCMTDSKGEVIEVFPTISAASAATGLANDTIRRHCDKHKIRPLPDGITFAWGDEVKE